MRESAGPESASQLLRAVVAEVIGGLAEVEVLEPSPGWLACVRLRGPEGRVCVLLTDGEWHEVQLAQPQVGVFIVSDEVAPTLSMLARASREYLLGRHKVLRERGLFGSKDTVVLETEDGEWRIGRRRSRRPA